MCVCVLAQETSCSDACQKHFNCDFECLCGCKDKIHLHENKVEQIQYKHRQNSDINTNANLTCEPGNVLVTGFWDNKS